MASTATERIDSVVVVGCGAVGLALCVAFASRNMRVLGVDIDSDRVASLGAGRLTIPERDLADELQKAISTDRLRFSTACTRISQRRAFILAAPTPVDEEGMPVMSHLQGASETALACARDHDLVVISSTVPVGTTRRIANAIAARNPTIVVACCPDRSTMGQSLREQFSVPHVIGGMTEAATQSAGALFHLLGKTIEVSTPEAAEAIKLFCNVGRDMTFALANYFALTADALGLDIAEIEKAATADYPRFGISRPGPVGGPCLTKDTMLLDHSVFKPDAPPSLALAARRLNASLLDHAAEAIAAHLTEMSTPRPVIALLGLAFKGDPKIADTRGGFAVTLAERLRTRWPAAIIRLWDPNASGDAGVDSILAGADVAVLANEHPLIKGLDLATAAGMMRPGGMIYDTCGGFDRTREAPPNGVRLRIFGRGSAL